MQRYTYGVHFCDIGMVLELISQNLSKVHLSREKLWHHANHIDVAVKTVRPQTETSEHLQAVPQFL